MQEIYEYIKSHSLYDDLLRWKNKYKNIYCVKVRDNFYIFRLLTRGEYLNIFNLQQHSSYSIDDMVLEECLLHPLYKKEWMDNRLAGEIDFLSKSVVKVSGFSRENELLNDVEQERSKIERLDNQILVLICKAFPHLNLEDVDNMDYPTLLRYLTIAETILDVKLTIEKPQKQGKIDFDKENYKLTGSSKSIFNTKKPKEEM